MKKYLAAILTAFMVAAFTGCSKAPEQPKPKTTEQLREEALANSEKNRKLQDLLEQQRSVALENASRNAATYFATNPRFDASWKTVPHTDDQITAACPQGSGWAWLNIMKVEGKDVEKKRIWCSTSSTSLGCYIDEDFVKGPHKQQANSCNAELPYPLKAFK